MTDYNFNDIKIIREGTFKIDPEEAEKFLGAFAKPRAFDITYSVPTTAPDGDYTQECLDEGTTFTMTGTLNSDPIPVKSAIVKDGILTFVGEASWAPMT